MNKNKNAISNESASGLHWLAAHSTPRLFEMKTLSCLSKKICRKSPADSRWSWFVPYSARQLRKRKNVPVQRHLFSCTLTSQFSRCEAVVWFISPQMTQVPPGGLDLQFEIKMTLEEAIRFKTFKNQIEMMKQLKINFLRIALFQADPKEKLGRS